MADQHYQQAHYETYLNNDGFNDSRLHTPTLRRLSFDSQPLQRHAHKLSAEQSVYNWNANPNQHSQGQPYYYKPPAPKQPRPIVIASAIEKSDFRTHLDGMADSVRGKIGRYFGKGKDSNSVRPGTASSGFRRNSLSIATPSINEVPSLVHSYPSSNSRPLAQPSASTQITRPHSDEAPSIPIINTYSGGGLITQNSWKLPISVSEQSEDKFWKADLTLNRLQSSWTQMVTLLSIFSLAAKMLVLRSHSESARKSCSR